MAGVSKTFRIISNFLHFLFDKDRRHKTPDVMVIFSLVFEKPEKAKRIIFCD